MGVPTSEVGYTPAMSRREDHEVHKGHVVALGKKKYFKDSVHISQHTFCYKCHPANDASGNNRCLLLESIEAHKYTAGKSRVLFK
jgi:cytochrome c553